MRNGMPRALTAGITFATAITGITLAMALPVAAQDAEDAPALEYPEGWEVRFDREGSSMDDLYLVVMPPGLHITTGPATIAYHPDSVATGDFRIESETFLFDPQGRREAFGFFVGGTDLRGPDQRYTYFLLREGGEFLVKTRSGTEARGLERFKAGRPTRRSCHSLPSRRTRARPRTSWSSKRRATSCASS